MDLALNGKIALVTGSSRGIGKAVAEGLLAEGASVIINGRGASNLERVRIELSRTSSPDHVTTFAGDLTDPSTVDAMRADLTRRRRLPYIVVANIGSGRSEGGWNVHPDEWKRMFDLNFFGAMTLIRSMLPHLIRKRWGRVIVVGSIAGLEAIPAPPPYSAAKAALTMAAQSLSRLTASSGVTVNVIAPGNILAPGGTWERKLKANPTAVRRYIRADVPAGRLGTPEEVAAAVAFLASEQAAFINGHCLVVDGGQTRSFA